ncbi:hypothetical protein B0H12DRAFT_1263757 [Mycena haematopus]|nr:hypothetical protein B0H12DRAFT_1263757 [Mycena haematopus]
MFGQLGHAKQSENETSPIVWLEIVTLQHHLPERQAPRRQGKYLAYASSLPSTLKRWVWASRHWMSAAPEREERQRTRAAASAPTTLNLIDILVLLRWTCAVERHGRGEREYHTGARGASARDGMCTEGGRRAREGVAWACVAMQGRPLRRGEEIAAVHKYIVRRRVLNPNPCASDPGDFTSDGVFFPHVPFDLQRCCVVASTSFFTPCALIRAYSLAPASASSALDSRDVEPENAAVDLNASPRRMERKTGDTCARLARQ